MTHLDAQLDQIKEAIFEMMIKTNRQVEKSKEAFINFDEDIAEEIVHNEKWINALELSIDRECENTFALFQPVATDLRFVISMLKINSDLERIADYAENIAKYVIEMEEPISDELIQKVKLNKMFDLAIKMTADISIAFENEDTKLAKKVFKQDKDLNKINNISSRIISEYIQSNPQEIRSALFLFSVIRKLERLGDHVKNIVEDFIFYLDAEIIKHKNKKYKVKS